MEAHRRGARANVHELWALLEEIDTLAPRVVVDVGSGVAVWWALWQVCGSVIGVASEPWQNSGVFSGTALPSGVTELVGDRRDQETRVRVADQVAGRPLDVLVLAAATSEDECRADFAAYAPMVRDGGLVVIYGIAALPGVAQFWRGLSTSDHRELVGSSGPAGYGVVTIHERDRASG
jgi:hypothetical protein